MTSEDFIKSFGKDYSTNGECQNCNACCTVNLPLTRSEYKYFKKLININIRGIRDFYKLVKEKGKYFLLCPFTNLKTKQCIIYDDRPSICKIYHCHNKGNEILKNYDIAMSSQRKHRLKDCLPKDIVRHIEEGERLKELEENKWH